MTIVKFGGYQKLYVDFQLYGVNNPNPRAVQGYVSFNLSLSLFLSYLYFVYIFKKNVILDFIPMSPIYVPLYMVWIWFQMRSLVKAVPVDLVTPNKCDFHSKEHIALGQITTKIID